MAQREVQADEAGLQGVVLAKFGKRGVNNKTN